MLTCKRNRCHLTRELPVRVQLLILQWKVWKEIYLCAAHLRSYLKYECLHIFLSWNIVPVWILMHIPICLSLASITVSGDWLPRSSSSTDQVSRCCALSDQLLATASICKQWELVINIAHRTAVERNPDLSTALIGMGQTMFSNRLFPEAAVCFEHAIPKVCCYLRRFSWSETVI